MKKNFLKASLVALVALWAAHITPALAEEISITTAKGDVMIKQIPQKIVALDVAVIDNLDAVGVKPAGILNGLYVDYLDHVAASDAVKVGTFFEPDFEAINAIEPDMVIVATRSARYLDQLNEFAPAIDLTSPWENFMQASIDAFKQTAKLVGKTTEGEVLVAKLEASATTLRDIVKSKGNALIIMTNGPKISAFGPGSRFGWVHDDLGVIPAIQDVEAVTHGEAITHEFVLKANPDWLIVVDRSAAIGQEGSAKATLDNELIAKTTAWQKGQVIYVNSATWYISGNGIQAMQATVNELTAAYSK
ncbi:MAG: siderophore ABC transporter substrate-binding protein [Hyphomicrobiales bacterium]